MKAQGIDSVEADGVLCQLSAPDVDGFRSLDRSPTSTLTFHFDPAFVASCPGGRKTKVRYAAWGEAVESLSDGAPSVSNARPFYDEDGDPQGSYRKGRAWVEHIVQTPVVCVTPA